MVVYCRIVLLVIKSDHRWHWRRLRIQIRTPGQHGGGGGRSRRVFFVCPSFVTSEVQTVRSYDTDSDIKEHSLVVVAVIVVIVDLPWRTSTI